MSRFPTIVRTAVGAVVSVAAVGAVLLAGSVPWPSVASAAPSTEIQPAAAEALLSCEGPLLALGRTADAADALSVAAQTSIVSGNADGETPESTDLAIDGVDGATATLVRQEPDGGEGVAVAAAASVTAADADLTGFAASTCREPLMESWIVGGDTATGTTGILLVSNPTEVNATITIDVFGVDGVTTPASGDGVAIPAGTEVPIAVAGIAGTEASPVIRVTATGAPVRVTLQSSIVRTLDPGGIDLQAPSTPATLQVVPGIAVTDDASASTNGELRLLSTSDTDATVTITKQGESDPVRDPESVSLTADVPLSVQLDGLEAGSYTVRVDAEQPVVAAVWQATGLGAGSDYAWYAATAPISTATLAAAPDGEGGEIELANAGDSDASVSITAPDGTVSQVDVAAGSSVGVALTGSGVYSIDPAGRTVYASITYATDSTIAAIPVEPDAAAPDAITVYP